MVISYDAYVRRSYITGYQSLEGPIVREDYRFCSLVWIHRSIWMVTACSRMLDHMDLS